MGKPPSGPLLEVSLSTRHACGAPHPAASRLPDSETLGARVGSGRVVLSGSVAHFHPEGRPECRACVQCLETASAQRPPTVVSHVSAPPGPLTSAGKGRGHARADLFSTSPVPLCLSPAEPEMDTKSRVVWVAGNSTKFSKTVARGGPARTEPDLARVGQIYSQQRGQRRLCPGKAVAWKTLSLSC